jgi:hypothetical protein
MLARQRQKKKVGSGTDHVKSLTLKGMSIAEGLNIVLGLDFPLLLQ